MPEYSYERAITKMNEHRTYSKNGNHQPVAAAKIMPKRVEFVAAKSKGLDPDKRIKSGSKAEKSGKNLLGRDKRVGWTQWHTVTPRHTQCKKKEQKKYTQIYVETLEPRENHGSTDDSKSTM